MIQSVIELLCKPKNWNIQLVLPPILFTLILIYFSKEYIYPTLKGPSLIRKIMNKFTEALSFSNALLQTHNPDRFSLTSDPKFKKRYNLALKLGGFPGGLQNDGNTCFMNSVLQCLASSNELVEFLNSFTGVLPFEDEKVEVDINIKEVQFSYSLMELLVNLNTPHGTRTPTYKTRNLLKVMKDGPNKHLFLGYNQEDAQEFYQSVMKQVEKEYTDLQKGNNIGSVSIHQTEQKLSKYVDYHDGMITGLNKLGLLGEVYVPATQIDPADASANGKYVGYNLVTPVDGLQCDRIGCVNCGEMGGIRYSVTSGLALNLPFDGANRSNFTLQELIEEWCKKELIDGVECNRCGLVAMNEGLIEKLGKLKEHETGLSGSTKLIEMMEIRIKEIKKVLEMKCVNDEIYKKLHTKNMVQKSQKAKQSFLARPPALLCIHVNRSVFDPKTFMVRKNNARIQFPLKLNLSDYVAESNDINMDARMEFRKQDDESDDKKEVNHRLEYSLKSLISHFGTHNYGHYIAFRKIRGNWWRISDEIVRLSTEDEVLNSQGIFMLFYELSERNDPKDESGVEFDEESEMEENSDSEEESDDDDDNDDDNGNNVDGESSEKSKKNTERQEHLINVQANL